MLPEFLLHLSLSDALLLLSVVPAIWFPAVYIFGWPRNTIPWWNVKEYGWIGVVTALHSFSVALLLSLVVYGIVFGQAIDEPYRVAVAGALLVALVSKVWMLHHERRQGRLARELADNQHYVEDHARATFLPARHHENGGTPDGTE